MSDPGILLERASDPRIARLILNRPARRNAFDGELVALLQRAARELAGDATTVSSSSRARARRFAPAPKSTG